ncbi:MAG: L-seryl-tRNA(Sec) selenium transferase, partial [Chloroflexota bacterium]
GRPLTLDTIREILDSLRALYETQGSVTIPNGEEILMRARKSLLTIASSSLQPVINATGVILHTNLGRAPLSETTIHVMQAIGMGYSTLEYDLKKGKRGSRYVHAEGLLTRLTGAESALVVNNNASALLLILAAFARRRKVLISRTQLIEIGGGFRIPDILKESGAKLFEIGATNKVHLADYKNAIEEEKIAMILRAHRSNFKMIGFTEEPKVKELAQLAAEAGIPMVDDLGSGTLLNTERFGLEHETTVQEALEAGADLVCFSGDKLLGGPQAGIIVGKEKMINKLKKAPMARAIRADKIALAGLSATLMHYLKDEAVREVPIWQMISTDAELIKERARKWMEHRGEGERVAGFSTVGGGSLPGESLPTFLLALDVPKPKKFVEALRRARPAIIARIEDKRVMIDPRTVMIKQEGGLLVGIQNALREHK